MRYIINEEKETVLDTETNQEYEYSDLEAMYEETYYEAYPDTELDNETIVYSLNCLLNHIKDGMKVDIMEIIYEMVY